MNWTKQSDALVLPFSHFLISTIGQSDPVLVKENNARAAIVGLRRRRARSVVDPLVHTHADAESAAKEVERFSFHFPADAATSKRSNAVLRGTRRADKAAGGGNASAPASCSGGSYW